LEDCIEGTYVFRDWAILGLADSYPERNSHLGAPQESLSCRRRTE
jgi:hypothetical protein